MGEKPSDQHLTWLVKNRSRNQKASIALHSLLVKHQEQIKANQRLMLIVQSLISINFSLWRAVFLTDKEEGTEKRHDHAEEFLIKLIVDNAVGYPLERSAKNWTFHYYLNNARYRLKELCESWPSLISKQQALTKAKPAKELWEFTQKGLETSTNNFSKALREKWSPS